MSAVVIAASHLASSLCEQLAYDGELVTFADTEPILALQAVLERPPRLIVLERLFAATPRGAALINRLKTEPRLAHAEVRVMSHTGDYMRHVSRSTLAGVVEGRGAQGPVQPSDRPPADFDEPRPPERSENRRAVRVRVAGGVEIQLDGTAASVVDVSPLGAQVVSSMVLRPNQRVRISITNEDVVLRFRGTVAWAKFELSSAGARPVYRAGVEFFDSDRAAIESFVARIRQ
ncbi:MAG: PilZ domain-containing protein [Vicinamibacterales bacterium]